MKKALIKNITFYIGAIAMFVLGVFYMLASDLAFNNNAYDLIVAVLLAFGSAILFFFSLNFNEKPVAMYILKALGVVLAIGFVVYVHFYQTGFSLGHLAAPDEVPNYPSILDTLQRAGKAKETELAASKATIIVALVLGYLSIAAQCLNTVFVAVLKED